LGYAVTKVDGGVQITLTIFVMSFATLVAAAFFVVLWNRPYVFYSPGEYGSTNPKDFVEAMRPGLLPQRMQDQITLAESIEKKPADSEPQFQLLQSMLGDFQKQLLILMHEESAAIPYASGWTSDLRYQVLTSGASPSFSVGMFIPERISQDLAGTGTIEMDLERFGPQLKLTAFGHEFAKWLVDNGQKAAFFETPYGKFGERRRPDGVEDEVWESMIAAADVKAAKRRLWAPGKKSAKTEPAAAPGVVTNPTGPDGEQAQPAAGE